MSGLLLKYIYKSRLCKFIRPFRCFKILSAIDLFDRFLIMIPLFKKKKKTNNR